MPRFPQAEPEIAALAALVVEGLEQAVEDFPNPPVPTTELRVKLDTYAQTRAATVVAETAFREQHAEKDEALEDLVDSTMYRTGAATPQSRVSNPGGEDEVRRTRIR